MKHQVLKTIQTRTKCEIPGLIPRGLQSILVTLVMRTIAYSLLPVYLDQLGVNISMLQVGRHKPPFLVTKGNVFRCFNHSAFFKTRVKSLSIALPIALEKIHLSRQILKHTLLRLIDCVCVLSLQASQETFLI